MGYGHPQTIKSRIRAGEVPAVQIGHKYKIDRADLHLIAKPVGSQKPTEPSAVSPRDLDAMAVQIVASWPRLGAARKAELARLLSNS